MEKFKLDLQILMERYQNAPRTDFSQFGKRGELTAANSDLFAEITLLVQELQN